MDSGWRNRRQHGGSEVFPASDMVVFHGGVEGCIIGLSLGVVWFDGVSKEGSDAVLVVAWRSCSFEMVEIVFYGCF